MLLTFSLSCFAARNVLHGKYDISQFNPLAFDFDGREYYSDSIICKTDDGSFIERLKIDETGLYIWVSSYSDYTPILESPYSSCTYLYFDNQSVYSDFFDAFTSCFQLIDDSLTDDNGNVPSDSTEDTFTSESNEEFIVSDIVAFSDINPISNSLFEQLSVTTVLAVIALLVGACVVLAFMWWGLRKIISAVMTAFKKGKISL